MSVSAKWSYWWTDRWCVVVDCCAASSKLSQSADEATIHPPSESQRQILSRYVTESAGDQTSAVTSLVDSRQGHHSIRATFHLDIAQRARPATDASDSAVIADSEHRMASSDLEERVRDWDFIGTYVVAVFYSASRNRVICFVNCFIYYCLYLWFCVFNYYESNWL